MKIKHAPSETNAYWFEGVGEHEILHLGCFAETLKKSLDVYGDLLGRLYADNPSLWIEFQSTKRWWLNERRRDRKLLWKTPVYEDESYLAIEVADKEEIREGLERFWLLKELRCYFWKQGSASVQTGGLLPGFARTEFKELTRFVPSATRFMAERDICNSYLRVMFHRSETKLVDQFLAQSAVRFGATLVLESAIFKTEDS
jgi:hypothetical protein